MIPGTNGYLISSIEFVEQPTKTHAMLIGEGHITGFTDGQEAMKQAIYKILNTERYEYVMYSWNYGIELKDLFGEPVSYVIPELERRIREALLWDSRITAVDGFEFEVPKKDTVHVTFTAHTVYGNVEAEREVNF